MNTREKGTPLAIIQARDLLFRATESRFFGKIAFQFQDGKIVLIRKEETVKVEKEDNL